jgi:hypothetical protein
MKKDDLTPPQQNTKPKLDLKDITKALSNKQISTTIQYNTDRDQLYIDLETRAKSELHLYEDGMLRGRYNYETQIDLSQDIESLITELCYEFNNALHGRSYCQIGWVELCESKKIKLEMYDS